jgi:hypothetical protein
VVKTSLPNCAMTHLAFVSTIWDGQVDTVGAINLNLESCPARNLRLNLADVEVRRGGHHLYRANSDTPPDVIMHGREEKDNR